MIYTQRANFPYPVLMNNSDDYVGAEFNFNLNLKDDDNDFILEIDWDMSSEFIEKQIKTGNAEVVLIIKSKDNQFHILPRTNHTSKRISRKKLCIGARTVMQLMVISKKEISFANNDDLNEFYDDLKNEISVKPGQVLAFSDTEIYDGSQEKPFDLFEKRVDPDHETDIDVELGDETIIIVYKDNKYQFAEKRYSKEYNYPYIYLGLQKALTRFILNHNVDNPDDGVDITTMNEPDNALEYKLYVLMQSKNIDTLYFENMDWVIQKISDNIIKRYADAIWRAGDED